MTPKRRASHRGGARCWVAVVAIFLAVPSLAADERAPRLDPPGLERRDAPGREGYRATGRDPAAPRELVLWRWHEDRFVRLASTRSEANGRFDFGERPLPDVETWFHVSPRDVEPEATNLVRIVRRLRAPTVIPDGEMSSSIFLVPAAGGGEFRIYDAASGHLLLRRPVARGVRPREALDLLDALSPTLPSAITIEQILDDGRRSESAFWRID